MPAAKSPAKRKAAAPSGKPVVRAKPVAAAPSKPVGKLLAAPSDEQRLALIAESAYLRAERRGFTGGSELEDWLQAEAEVDGFIAIQTTARKLKRRSGNPMPGR